MLSATFAGRVKCIYIDPPSNTGNKDFVYNDRFVDKEDLWRHSKWCEFMFQRLTLAKDLLRQDGVIFVSISGDVKRLVDYTPNWRLRVGDWRVLFDVSGNKIVIHRIVHRSEAYE